MKKLYDKICEIEINIASLLLISTVFILFSSAILRTVGKPVNWGWDIALLFFTWSAFLAGDIAFRENEMVLVDIFVTRFPKKLQRALELIVYLIIFVFLGALIYLGI